MNQLSLAVDRGDLQAANLPDAEPGCVCCRQRNSVAQSHNGLQEAGDLVGSQNGPQLFRLPPIDDPLERILLAHRDAKEEAQRASRLIDVRPGALLGDEMKLISSDILNAETIRRCPKMVIDERADAPQRDALAKILTGQETLDMATMWWVYAAMSPTKLPPIFAKIDLESTWTADLGGWRSLEWFRRRARRSAIQ